MTYKAKRHGCFENWGDGYKALFMAIVKQATIDIRPTHVRENPARALDASLFLVECGPEFCEAVGWPVDPRHWEVLLNGKI
jgi:hypothetical protein